MAALSIERIVNLVVSGIIISPNQFRSSSNVDLILQELITSISRELTLDISNLKYELRVKYIIEFGKCLLCLPYLSSLFGVSATINKNKTQEQSIRIMLTSLLTLFGHTEMKQFMANSSNGSSGSGSGGDDSDSLDTYRVELICYTLLYRQTSFLLSSSFSSRLNLPEALTQLTLHRLDVAGLCDDVKHAVTSVVNSISEELESSDNNRNPEGMCGVVLV